MRAIKFRLLPPRLIVLVVLLTQGAGCAPVDLAAFMHEFAREALSAALL